MALKIKIPKQYGIIKRPRSTLNRKGLQGAAQGHHETVAAVSVRRARSSDAHEGSRKKGFSIESVRFGKSRSTQSHKRAGGKDLGSGAGGTHYKFYLFEITSIFMKQPRSLQSGPPKPPSAGANKRLVSKNTI